MTKKKLAAAFPKWNWPVVKATNAKRNTMRDEAPLSRLSPSMMLTIAFGTLTPRIMAVAETASGGETMPPKRKPKAKVKPGIKAPDTNANTHEE